MITQEFHTAVAAKNIKKTASNKAALTAIETAVNKGGNFAYDYTLFTGYNSLTDDDIATLEGYRAKYSKTHPAFNKMYEQYKWRLEPKTGATEKVKPVSPKANPSGSLGNTVGGVTPGL